jgi:anthranilate/para-aminobenzoate synthase component I
MPFFIDGVEYLEDINLTQEEFYEKLKNDADISTSQPSIGTLQEYFDEFKIIKDAKELEFMGGLVGSLGYDYIRYTEKLPDDNPDEIGIETIQLMLASRLSITSVYQ